MQIQLMFTPTQRHPSGYPGIKGEIDKRKDTAMAVIHRNGHHKNPIVDLGKP
jgi:hypothetical protein